MSRGDHLVLKGSIAGIPYEHHGIDMGDGTVIHLAPAEGARITLRDSEGRFSVRRSSAQEFAQDRPVYVVTHQQPLHPDEITSRAVSMLGQTGYNLLNGNCEHFAMYCVTGNASSRQVEMGQAAVAAVASATAKAFWCTTGRLGTRLAVKGAVKLHPAALVADGVEVIALAVGCQRGLSVDRARKVARVSSNLTALGLGAIVGGPVGAGVFLATHASSTAIADKLCQTARHLLSLSR